MLTPSASLIRTRLKDLVGAKINSSIELKNLRKATMHDVNVHEETNSILKEMEKSKFFYQWEFLHLFQDSLQLA